MSFFVAFLVYSPSHVMYFWMAPINIHNTAKGGFLYDVENMKISCNIILAGWHLLKRDIILDYFKFHLFWLWPYIKRATY